MTSPHHRTLLSAALIAGLAAAAGAQNLTGGVQHDPRADTVTYTLDIDGPPGGQAFTFVSLLQSPFPIQFGGIHGALLIDPLLGAPLHSLQLDPLGRGQDQLVAPMSVANGLPVFTQAVVIDQAMQLAFTDFAAAVFFAPPPLPPIPAGMGIASDVNGGNVNVNITGGPAGGNVTVWVNGGQRATGRMVLDGNGDGSISVPVPGIARGDRVTILVNGQPVQTWRH